MQGCGDFNKSSPSEFCILVENWCLSLSSFRVHTVRLQSQWGNIQFSLVQSLSCVWLFATPWVAACQVSRSITNSRSSLRLTSIKSVTPSSHLILCCPLLLLPPIPHSIRVFSNESTLRMRWPNVTVIHNSICQFDWAKGCPYSW